MKNWVGVDRVRTVLGMLVAACLCGCAGGRVAVNDQFLHNESKRVAVLPFYGLAPHSDNFTDALITEIVNMGYSVIERAALLQLFKEQNLQVSGAINAQQAAETGRMAGVDLVVVGAVTVREVMPIGEYLFGNGVTQDQIYSVHMRWVEVQTGEVMASASFMNPRGGSAQFAARKISSSLDQKVAELARAQKPRREVIAVNRPPLWQRRQEEIGWNGKNDTKSKPEN